MTVQVAMCSLSRLAYQKRIEMEGETSMAENEKALLGGIQKFSTEDGPGIRTTVFFKGCPINCKWCHNPDLISYKPQLLHSPSKCIGCGACIKACPNGAVSSGENGIQIDRNLCKSCGVCVETCYTDALKLSGESKSVDDIMTEVLTDKSFYDRTGGGVTLSGGEVTSHADFAGKVVEACQKKKIGVAIDTCGYSAYEDLEKLVRGSQWVLYDIKCIDSDKHKELTGVPNELILENLRKLAADADLKSKIIIRMPLVHPVNDSMEYMKRTCDFLNELGLKTVNGIPYHSMGLSKTRSLGLDPVEFETPSDEYMDEIRALFTKEGLNFTIMGRDEN